MCVFVCVQVDSIVWLCAVVDLLYSPQAPRNSFLLVGIVDKQIVESGECQCRSDGTKNRAAVWGARCGGCL